MPFDGAGNFVRSYDFEDDRNNGIKILAARVDGEFDNIAAGLNNVFFRNGIIAMTGDINVGLNKVVGLGSGSIGAPAISFGSDVATGIWLNGVGRLSVSAQGGNVAEFNANGFTVTKGIGASSVRAIGADLSGASGAGAEILYTGGVAVFQGYNRTAAASVPVRVDGSTIALALSGTQKALLDGSGLNVTTPLLQSGNQVWHAGNLTPGSYAALTGATFTGNVGAPAFLVDTTFFQTLVTGNPTISFDTGDTILYNRSTNNFQVGIGSVGKFTVAPTGSSFADGLSVGGALNSVGAITQNGAQVWHSGNFSPALYATLAGGAAFTGAITQSGNQVWHVGNLTPASYAPLAGATFTGDVIRSGQGKYFYDGMNRASSKITDGTAAPSGGSDGDIYFQYV